MARIKKQISRTLFLEYNHFLSHRQGSVCIAKRIYARYPIQLLRMQQRHAIYMQTTHSRLMPHSKIVQFKQPTNKPKSYPKMETCAKHKSKSLVRLAITEHESKRQALTRKSYVGMVFTLTNTPSWLTELMYLLYNPTHALFTL